MEGFQYSVIIPVYNSAGTLVELEQHLADLFVSISATYELIFVDDGSKDDSWKTLRALKEGKDNIKLIKLAKNAGQHNATLCGIHHSTGDFIITIDDDLQISPKEITKLIYCMEETEADMVYGIFPIKKHGIIRKLGSWMVNKFFNVFANTSGKGSSFRLITRQLADNLKLINQQYLLLDEVLSWYTDDITNVDVEHHPRADGKSGYSILKLVLLTLNYVINYTVIPLRIMTYMGLVFSLITFGISVFYIYNKYVNSVELGFTSLIVAIFFSTSLILFCLGIIGEYISRLYAKKGTAHYVIKEIR